jgi:glutamine amidotransferase
MKKQVTIVDYGVGNLFSVSRALEQCGAEVVISADPAQIEASERLILPGVGAFADGMSGLHNCGLIEPIRHFAASGRPLLGICLGMQMLASGSQEFGSHNGLGLIPGQVVPLPKVVEDGRVLKIPHIGWDIVNAAHQWEGSMMANTKPGTAVYLVHSFHVVPDEPQHVLATYGFGEQSITAAIRRGNIQGCQFHPEKSGPAGLRMLSAFVNTPAS